MTVLPHTATDCAHCDWRVVQALQCSGALVWVHCGTQLYACSDGTGQAQPVHESR